MYARASSLGTLPNKAGDKMTSITMDNLKDIVDYRVIAISSNITIDITKNCYVNTNTTDGTVKLVYECPSDMSAYTGYSVIKFRKKS